MYHFTSIIFVIRVKSTKSAKFMRHENLVLYSTFGGYHRVNRQTDKYENPQVTVELVALLGTPAGNQ